MESEAFGQGLVDKRCEDCGIACRARVCDREIELRRAAEEKAQAAVEDSLRYLAVKDAAEQERDAALAERDARALDEALRAQRVNVEALRHKVEEMRKNLAAVDARADERFAARLRECQADADRRVGAVRAEIEAAREELAAVRFGEALRREGINAAMELIWAAGRREKGAPRNDRELVAALTRVLSLARKHAQ